MLGCFSPLPRCWRKHLFAANSDSHSLLPQWVLGENGSTKAKLVHMATYQPPSLKGRCLFKKLLLSCKCVLILLYIPQTWMKNPMLSWNMSVKIQTFVSKNSLICWFLCRLWLWISVPCQIRSKNSCGSVLDHPGLGAAAATCSLSHTQICCC